MHTYDFIIKKDDQWLDCSVVSHSIESATERVQDTFKCPVYPLRMVRKPIPIDAVSGMYSSLQ